MGKITNMQNNQDNVNLSYVKNAQKNLNKPRLKIKTVKDLATLIGPNASKYRISPNQRNFQLKGRLTIAAIAAALAIGGTAVSMHNHTQKNNAIETSVQNNDELEKEDVLSRAEERFLTFFYHDKLTLKDNAYIEYSHNDELNTDTLEVYFKVSSPNSKPIKDFSYTRFNNWQDRLMNPDRNNPEVSALLDAMIDTYNNKNISQEDLKDLDTKTSNFDFSKFKLEGTHIVAANEKEHGQER